MTQASEHWTSRQSVSFESPNDIRSFLGCHPVTARILWNRGIQSQDALELFLKPELSRLPNPYNLYELEKAVERVTHAILNQEKIAIYGDYDVDGTCGASLLFDLFRQIGVHALCYQPNRFTEGYGVHLAPIEQLIDQGVNVILTVDCGITAVASAQVAQSRGVDMIILDHHKLGLELPPAYAVVNPQRPEDTSGLKNLCGTGLAFFFAIALRSQLRKTGYFSAANKTEPNLVRFLDLVAIATVADMVDIRGVNRILVSHGLKVMAKNPRPGIKALLQAAAITKPTATHCGFILGPRINAAGRLQSAQAALDLLTCEDLKHAQALALELEQINAERRQTQDKVAGEARIQAQNQLSDPLWQELSVQLPATAFGPWPRALVLWSEEWHEGIVGIVASKIVEEFGRPALILTAKEGSSGILKGSVRSIPKIDILAAISAESVACHLLNYGGHAHAGGISLEKARVQDFLTALNQHLALTTDHTHFHREQRYDAEVRLDEIDSQLVEELEMLAPFGHQFPDPVLKLVGAQVANIKIMKEKHLKLKLSTDKKGSEIEAVWFNALSKSLLAQDAEQTSQQNSSQNPLINSLTCSSGHFWINPQWNEWQGMRRLQLRISHYQTHTTVE